MTYYQELTRMAKINMAIANKRENVSNWISQFLLLGVHTGSITLESSLGSFIKNEDIYIIFYDPAILLIGIYLKKSEGDVDTCILGNMDKNCYNQLQNPYVH